MCNEHADLSIWRWLCGAVVSDDDEVALATSYDGRRRCIVAVCHRHSDPL
jgi:hypothetical protein